MDKPIKIVLFDHDDTLVSTREIKWKHHKYVAKKFYGKDLVDKDIVPHWGKPLPELVCLLYGTDNVVEALAHNTSCHEDFPKILYPGTIPVLRHLHSKGILTGIVTATTRFSFEHDLKLHHIPKNFIDYTQTAEDTRYHKPNPKVFKPALQWINKYHTVPAEVLYVGDGLQDMSAAKGAGFKFIGVETGLTRAKQFHEFKVESIPTIADLTEKLNQLNFLT